ncbi:DUF3313 family protein [Ferrimonas balearica]|uniref:DUF3313 family protein n=1 Tax=Ferrimonas balearica TaxID=44012 RepID=UPI001C94AB85|nr:DUF3313 family protein [Ferrimonas balearica]MBY5979688.1 DUF3313 domain-containing protein [Ferrimonas balearica]
MMKDVYDSIKTTAVLMMLVILSACSSKEVTVQNYEIISDVSELTVAEGEDIGIILVRPGAPGLEDYERFIIDPVHIVYTDPNMKELSTEQVAKMQSYLQQAVIKQLDDGGYEVGTKSKPQTLRITFTISGLKAPSAAANVTSALAPFAISVGEVTIEAVFREAVSNRIDGVAVMQSRGARFLNATPWSTWADVESTFDQWAKSFRQSLDEAHGK